jgi:hypothetical protein
MRRVRRLFALLLAAMLLASCGSGPQDGAREHVKELIKARGFNLEPGSGVAVQFVPADSTTTGTVTVNLTPNWNNSGGQTVRYATASFELSADGSSIKIGCLDTAGHVIDFNDDPHMRDVFTVAQGCPPPLPPPSPSGSSPPATS